LPPARGKPMLGARARSGGVGTLAQHLPDLPLTPDAVEDFDRDPVVSKRKRNLFQALDRCPVPAPLGQKQVLGVGARAAPASLTLDQPPPEQDAADHSVDKRPALELLAPTESCR
jgi:hypothetical protein